MGYRDFRGALPSNLIIFSRPLGLNYDPPLRPAFPPLLCSLEASAHGQRTAGGEGHCDSLDLRGSPFPLSRAPPVSMHIRPVGGRGF